MATTDTSGDIAADTTTSFIVAVPYQGANGPVAGSYAQVLRMGSWDTTIEAGIVDSSGNKMQTATTKDGITTITNPNYAGSDPLQNAGVLVYSADQYTVYSPSIVMVGSQSSSSWSDENLTVTTSGNSVQAYTYSGPAGMNATYSRANSLGMTLGYSATFVVGSLMTVWAGNDASTGVGGLLWSNFGLTQNIFDGQVVNINGATISVQGIGETSLTTNASIVATTSITLTVNPLTAGATSALTVATTLGQAARFAGDAVVALGGAAVDAAIGISTDELDATKTKISTSVDDSYDSALAISAAIIAIQAIASLSGIVMSAAATGLAAATTSGQLELGLVRSSLSQGYQSGVNVTVGAVAIASPDTEVEGFASLTLTSGTSSIAITPAGIILTVGGSNIAITAASIIATGATQGFNP